ncbi:MAG: Activator of Hsp90 ATPase 1 family protein [Actinomycetia bacterium]|nr:Activator of Hsp90 ATPase 1 family protein [Actinomycetes bacterium]
MSVHHQVELPATPVEVYELLADAAALSALSRMSGTAGRAAGEEFTAFDGHVTGRQVELAPGAMLVQAWRFPVWEPGMYTIVRFTLEAAVAPVPLVSTTDDSRTRSRLLGAPVETRLRIDQYAEPEGADTLGCHPAWRDHLDAGWLLFYLTPLVRHFTQVASAKVTAAYEIEALADAMHPLTGAERHG